MKLLLKPLQAGSLNLSNRLVMPPMATSKAEPDGKVSKATLDYYAEKSEGGYISLIIIEHNFISRQGKASNNQMSIAEDSVIQNLRKLSGIIHRNGSKCIIQINHAGSAADKEIIGSIPVGPSAVSNPRADHGIPHALTKAEISDIVTDFKNAARRVKEAGFDGVEIHSAHGYLLNQFLSPLTNKRTDEYGGNILNRIRFHLEVIAAVKKEVGADFPIFIRLGASDYTEGGTRIEDSVIASQAFEKAGVSVIDVSGGFCGFTRSDAAELSYFGALSEAIKKNVSIPVLLTGGITDSDSAEQLLDEGKADLIGVGRAILKDSQWAKNAIEKLK
jgi:NADPH2 dehydrogenase